MRKRILVLVAISVNLLCGVGASGVVFEDDFSDQNWTEDNWTFTGKNTSTCSEDTPTHTVQDGILCFSGPGNTNYHYWALCNSGPIDYCCIETRIRMTPSAHDNDNMSICWRSSPGGYGCGLECLKGGSNYANLREFNRWFCDGGRGLFLIDHTWDNSWHDLVVEVKPGSSPGSDSVFCFVDGQLLVCHEITDPVSSSGSVGLDFAWANTVCCDYFRVTTPECPTRPYEITSVSFDDSVYQNGVDTVHVSVISTSNWGASENLRLSAQLTASGVVYDLGYELFSLATGEERLSQFDWPVPANDAPCEFDATIVLSDGATVSWPLTVKAEEDAFVGTPLSQGEIDDQVSQLEACAIFPGGQLITELAAAATYGTLVSPGFSAVGSFISVKENACRAEVYRNEDDTCRETVANVFVGVGIAATCVAAVGIFILSAGLALPAEVTFATMLYSVFMAGFSVIGESNFANWYCENFGALQAGSGSIQVGAGDRVRGLLDYVDEISDSTGVSFSSHIAVEGPVSLMLEMPMGWCCPESTSVDDAAGFVFAPDTLQWVSIGTTASRFQAGFDTTASVRDSLWPKAVAMKATKSGDVYFGLAGRAVGSSETFLLYYPMVSVEDSSMLTLEIDDHFDGYLLEIDYDGDGTIDEVKYPENFFFEQPAITQIIDIPGDQGGQVTVSWQRSRYDAGGDSVVITGYSVYGRVIDTPSNQVGVAEDGPFRTSVLGYPPGSWYYILTVPARGERFYNCVAPTLCDSTSDGMCWSAFFVSALTPDPLIYFDSEPDSGCSTDNLAPSPPESLSMSSPSELVWFESDEPDFKEYAVSGSDQSQYNESATLIAMCCTASLDISDRVFPYYHVTAIDSAGNESVAATVENVHANAFGFGDRPEDRGVIHCEPNPFVYEIAISFSLLAPGRVRLAVYTPEGRQVSLLADGVMPVGRNTIRWRGTDGRGNRLPPGVYFCRLEADDLSQTRKMLLLE